jgi:hypothetical protein
MNKLIENAKAHYRRLVDEPKEIHVPEWGEDGAPAVIYVTPMTLNERAKLNRFVKNNMEMAAEVLILKAKDKDGSALFTKEDKPDLMRSVDSAVIARIAEEIVGGDEETLVEEAEKN